MILGIVAGTVVNTQTADRIESAKYLLVDRCDPRGQRKGDYHVALDTMDAGPGEMVFVSLGSPARNTQRTVDGAIDALILGIVDLIDVNDEIVYRK